MTWISAGPTLHRMILDHAGAPPASLRFIRSCSSALSPALMREAEERYGVPMIEAYGMTEAGHQMTSNPLPPGRRIPGLGGRAGRRRRAHGRPVGRGRPTRHAGEVAIRGPGLTPGYLNNPQANAESFFDGWFRTGDEGVLEDGYLHLRGRLKEMILRGGENISPLEIETVLLAHPDVGEAVASAWTTTNTARPSPRRWCWPAAQRRPSCARTPRSLAAFKVPDRIHVLDEIPKTPTGKVQRSRMPSHLEGRPS